MINAAKRRTGTARKLIRKIGNAIRNKKKHTRKSKKYQIIDMSYPPTCTAAIITI